NRADEIGNVIAGDPLVHSVRRAGEVPEVQHGPFEPALDVLSDISEKMTDMPKHRHPTYPHQAKQICRDRRGHGGHGRRQQALRGPVPNWVCASALNFETGLKVSRSSAVR